MYIISNRIQEDIKHNRRGVGSDLSLSNSRSDSGTNAFEEDTEDDLEMGGKNNYNNDSTQEEDDNMAGDTESTTGDDDNSEDEADSDDDDNSDNDDVSGCDNNVDEDYDEDSDDNNTTIASRSFFTKNAFQDGRILDFAFLQEVSIDME